MSRSLYARLAQRFDQDRVLLSRRGLLKSAALFAASGALASVSRALQPADAPKPAASSKKKVIVIGAGFGGLACALELVARGHDVAIHEGRGRVGGRVLTMRDITDNAGIEAGGEWIGANHPTWLALAKRFNIDLAETPDAEDLYAPLYLKGKLLDAQQTEALYEQMSKILEALNDAAKDIDPLAPWTAPAAQQLDRMTAAQWLAEQECTELCRTAIEAQLTNDNGVSMGWQSYLAHLAMIKGGGLQDYWENSEVFRARQGNQELATRMYMELTPERFTLGNVITRIQVNDNSVIVTDARDRKHEADFAVLAVAPTVWRNIEFVPALPSALAPQMGFASKMLCSFKKPAWKDLGLAPDSLSDTEIGYTWESTGIHAAARNPVLCAFSGGPGAEMGLRLNEPERNEQYKERLQRIYKGIGEHIDSMRFIGWPTDRWTMGGYSFPAPGQVTTCLRALNIGYKRLHFAGEHVSTAFPGYMEGALSAGTAAATRIDAS
ncbi:MAG: FAD-dependent oxidoreductase [Phycisphaerales bacterium]|nr:FAD-dependent oxidoreductase [Phycisphaerales bacterium]